MRRRAPFDRLLCDGRLAGAGYVLYMPSSIRQKILLTGGAGYIASHTFVALHEASFEPVILDNFANAHVEVLERLKRITYRTPLLERGDVLDRPFVESVLQRHRPVAVVHFAGDKAVSDSVNQPLKYFHHNLCGAVSILQAMEAVYLGGDAPRSPTLASSSSATVYGDAASMPINEDFPRSHTNPYGQTKLMIEDMLPAVHKAQPSWRIGVLRYFNPAGAHPSGLIGEDPSGVPNNLVPYVSQVAAGTRTHLNVYGRDFPTIDGTGVRDYIHVQDLATGQVAAVQKAFSVAGRFQCQPRNGPRSQRVRPSHPIQVCGSPARRRRQLLCRSDARARLARMGSTAHIGRHVP